MFYTTETYHDNLQAKMPESNFILKNFTGSEKPCDILCLICGKEQHFSSAQLLLRRYRRNCKNVCSNCENNTHNLQHKLTQENGNKMLKEKQTLKPQDKMKIVWSSKVPVKWLCTKCNNTFDRAPASMYFRNSFSCLWCEGRPQEYTEEMIKFKIAQKWGNEYSFIEKAGRIATGKGLRIKVRHNICGFIWIVDFFHFIKEGTGCPRCKSSKGEKKIRKYLQDNNIIFEEQKAVLVNNRYLRFDFYIESKNKKIAIEYNGIQHYEKIGFFGGEEGFIKQQQRDKEKEEYCKKHNIELIIIPYNNETLLQTNLLAQRLNGQAV